MGSKSLQVRYVGDISGVRAALAQMDAAHASFASKMSAVGKKMSSIGKSLTTYVTLPIVGIGVVATKMAVDYEAAFTKIAAVSNASAADVRKWKDEIKGLAGRTARDPRELADALYFLSSAGLNASQIMPTLASSAKAAAAGLGNTADVARLTANVLNAYAGSGIKAADVTDTLVAAVREGSADTDEFGTAIGRILPIASKAGVTFDQVAASLASLSNIGLDVDEGVTAMRGLLMALEAPGTQAANTLAEIGISADEMRAAIAEEGLLGALRLLEERTNGNIDVMRKIVPNVRALTGVFGLTGQAAEKVDGIFQRVANSAGSVDKAFATTAKGEQFKFQQALVKLKVAAIELGEKLLPIALKIADAVKGIAEWFTKLSPKTQELIIKFGLLAAALGPVLRIFGGILRIGGGVIGIITRLAGAAAGAAGGGAGLGAMAGSLGALSAVAGPAAIAVGTVAGALVAHAVVARADANETAEATAKYKAQGLTLAEARSQLVQFTDSTMVGYQTVNASQYALQKYIKSLEQTANNISGVTSAQETLWFVMKDAVGVTEEQRTKLRGLLVTLASYGGALTDVQKQQVQNLLEMGDFAGALKIVQDALKGAREKADALTESIKRIPAKKAIEIIADTKQARSAVASFRSWVMNMGPVSIDVAARLYKTDFGQVGSGLSKGMDDSKPRVQASADRLGKAALNSLKTRLGISSPSKETIKIGKNVVEGLIEGLTSNAHLIRDAWEKVAKVLERGLNDTLDKVQKRLDAVLSRASDFRSSIAGGFNELLSLGNMEEGADIGSFVQAQLKTAQQFADVLIALKAQGAGAPLLAEIASVGPSAIPFAQQLLQLGPEQLTTLNAQYEAIAGIQKATADSLTNAFFGDRIAALRERLQDVKETLRSIEKIVNFISVHGVGPSRSEIGKGGQLTELANTVGKPPVQVNVTVQGWVGNDQDIAARLERELVKALARGGSLFNGTVKK